MPRIFVVLLSTVLYCGCASTGSLDNSRALEAARTNTQLGVEYMRNGDYALARKRLEKAIAQAPDQPDAHTAIAVLYERVGDLGMAEKHYRKSLRLAPDNPRAHNNYGQYLCSQGRQEQALEHFTQAAANAYYRTPWIPLSNAGVCLLGVPDNRRAEEYFRLALAKKEDYRPALLHMARLRFEAGHYLGARAFLERIQATSAHTPESLWLGVQTEYALKDRKAWGKYALRLKNDYPDSRQSALLQDWENERRAGQ